jgi:hypothetical protein
MWGRNKIEAELRRRGFNGTVSYPYRTTSFLMEDWDFEESHWRHWAALAEQDSNVWSRVVERILVQPESFLSDATSARALQVATTGSTRAITYEQLPPTWILWSCHVSLTRVVSCTNPQSFFCGHLRPSHLWTWNHLSTADSTEK